MFSIFSKNELSLKYSKESNIIVSSHTFKMYCEPFIQGHAQGNTVFITVSYGVILYYSSYGFYYLLLESQAYFLNKTRICQIHYLSLCANYNVHFKIIGYQASMSFN